MDDLTKLSDDELRARWNRVDWIAGDPEHEALVAEMQRRELDF
jgi:hypothetical protein